MRIRTRGRHLAGVACFATETAIRVITIRCTRSRGPRGFFCLQVDRRGPVIVDVMRLNKQMANTESDPFTLLCRHLVALTGTYVIAPPEQRQSFREIGVPPDAERIHYTFSALPVVFDDEWYILTAGHAVIPYVEAIQTEKIFSTGGALLDSLASGDVDSKWIPFEIADFCEYMIDDESLGLDYAMLKLSSNHTALIQTRNVLPLFLTPNESEHIRNDPRCILAGMPSEFGELLNTEPSKRNEIFLRPTTIPLERKGDDQLPFPRLVGTIKTMDDLQSIVGTSGGPIFQFGNDQYTAVAVQSRWHEPSRTVYASQTTEICKHFASVMANKSGDNDA